MGYLFIIKNRIISPSANPPMMMSPM